MPNEPASPGSKERGGLWTILAKAEDTRGGLDRAAERDIAAHILTTSAVLLGLCLTILGIVRDPKNPDELVSIVDDLVAVDALVFLAACFVSYAALRSGPLGRIRRLEAIADRFFLLGLAGIALACVLFVWTLL